MKISYSSLLRCCLAAASLTVAVTAVHAQTVSTWTGGNGNWGNAALWSNGIPNSAAASDELKVGGALTLDGTLNVNALTGFGAGRYDLIDYTGTLTNNTLDLDTLPSDHAYKIDTSIAGQVDLVVTNAVPEPAT